MSPIFLLLIILLLLPAQGFAATVRLVVAAPGTIHLEGEGFSQVAAADLILTFDPTSFTPQKVQAGSLIEDALLANNPGADRVRLAFVKSGTIEGAGRLAVISGLAKNGAGPRELRLHGTLLDGQGNSLHWRAEIPPGNGLAEFRAEPTDSPRNIVSASPVLPQAPGNRMQMEQSAYHSTISLIVDGTTIVPSQYDESPKRLATDVLPVDGDETSGYAGRDFSRTIDEATKQKEGLADYSAPEKRSFSSVLKRFMEYDGTRSIDNLGRLFEDVLPPTVTQLPAVAFSDGQTPVILRIAGKDDQSQPNLALSAGRLLRTSRCVGEEGWEISLLPEKGSMGLVVYVLDQGRLLEIPITVVPRLEQIDENICGSADFAVKPVPQEMTKGDDNNNGGMAPIEDYLFIGNCLALQTVSAK